MAIDMVSGGSAPIDMTVTRWSTRAEAEQLASAFNETGTDALLRRLERLPRAGFLRVGGGLGVDVHFAQLTVDPDGRQRVLLIADRRMSTAEIATMAFSTQYPLAVIELRLDTEANGEGTMWPVARITYWDPSTQTVVIDNYTQTPLNLMGARWQRSPSD